MDEFSKKPVLKQETKRDLPQESPATSSRRRFLGIGVAAAVAGLTGFGAGVRFSEQPKEPLLKPVQPAQPVQRPREPLGSRKFKARNRAILQRHNEQTREVVERLRLKYHNAVFGKARVWDLIEKLAFCVDETDQSLYCTSQFVHVQQVLAAMEQDGIEEHDLFLAALLHDLGKVTLLTDELPENVLCSAVPIGEATHGAGLDRVIYQFCHGEIVYSRLKDHVPDHIAWVLRYHNISIEKSAPYMNERDRTYTAKYLTTFQKYDRGFKSYASMPQIDLKKYRDLIEQTFPNPILF